jgi:hypothetical protein
MNLRRISRVDATTVAALILLLLALSLVLLRSPLVVARRSADVSSSVTLGFATRGATYCQSHERLPKGTEAVRLWIGSALAGPRVALAALVAGRKVLSGAREAGWGGLTVTVPVRPLARSLPDVTVCASFGLHYGHVALAGERTPRASAMRNGGRVLAGRLLIEYLRPARSAWASMTVPIARRMGLGRAWSGTWVVLLALGLLIAMISLIVSLLQRELR